MSKHNWPSVQITTLRIFTFVLLFACLPIVSRGEGKATLVAGPRSTAYEGVWIERDGSRVFLATEPTVAVLCFLPMAASPRLLHHGEGYYNTGIRVWLMEDGRSFPHNAKLSKTPGSLLEYSPHHAVAEVIWNEIPGKEIRLEIAVSLVRDDLLEIRSTVFNMADDARTLAPWSIAGFPNQGEIVLPLRTDSFREIVLFDQADGDVLTDRLGGDAFRMNLADSNPGEEFKLGVVTPPGWGYYRKGRELWLSHVAYESGQSYAEGGSNLTIYRSEDNANHSSWGELEHVGADRLCEPGESVSMVQRVLRRRLSDRKVTLENVRPIATETFDKER